MELSDHTTWQTALTEAPRDEDPVAEATGETDRGRGEDISGPSSGDPGIPVEGMALLRDLMGSETDPGQFTNLLVSWAADVTSAIARSDFTEAAAWLAAVRIAPTYVSGFAGRVDAAFDTMSRPEVLDDLLARLSASEPCDGGPELVAAWGAPLAEYMIDLMVVDDPPVSRRRLIEFLGWAGRSDVRVLAAHLNDPRWFVVRNLAIALGKTGRASAVPALVQLVSHPEPRVRVEVLRSLALLDGEGTLDHVAAGLEDRSSRVRHAALTLLRANPSPMVVATLASALESGPVDSEQARRIVSAIAERRGDGTVAALDKIARRRFSVGTGRAARDAARAALQKLGHASDSR
jgi:hypothetical protein